MPGATVRELRVSALMRVLSFAHVQSEAHPRPDGDATVYEAYPLRMGLSWYRRSAASSERGEDPRSQ
jgi:hypothetical protein